MMIMTFEEECGGARASSRLGCGAAYLDEMAAVRWRPENTVSKPPRQLSRFSPAPSIGKRPVSTRHLPCLWKVWVLSN